MGPGCTGGCTKGKGWARGGRVTALNPRWALSVPGSLTLPASTDCPSGRGQPVPASVPPYSSLPEKGHFEKAFGSVQHSKLWPSWALRGAFPDAHGMDSSCWGSARHIRAASEPSRPQPGRGPLLGLPGSWTHQKWVPEREAEGIRSLTSALYLERHSCFRMQLARLKTSSRGIHCFLSARHALTHHLLYLSDLSQTG